jgi:hypothetical protein
MQVDALALQLRPRPRYEAADLGVRLVQAHAASVWRTAAPVWLALALLALATAEIAPWLPALLLFWLKPWYDRTLLFVFARAAFGDSTRWPQLWQARRAVWWQGCWHSLTVARLSPWRSFTAPVRQLEGQRGRDARTRSRQLLAHQRGAVGAVFTAFAHAEAFLSLGLLSLAVWFVPGPERGSVARWFLMSQDTLAGILVWQLSYAAVVLFLEPFFVAAGFAMYLNRRVELEAWDIEQEFRRAF